MIKNTPDRSQLRAAAERLGKYAESLTADELNEKSRMLIEMKESLENTLHLLDEAEEADAAARL